MRCDVPLWRFTVQPMRSSAANAYLLRGGSSVLFLHGFSADRSTPAVNPELVFHRYGDTYFLSQIWESEETLGSQIPISRSEKSLAQNTKPVTMALAMTH